MNSLYDTCLKQLLDLFPELASKISLQNIRKNSKQLNYNLAEDATVDHSLIFNIKNNKKLFSNRKVLFAHFSPYKYELEGWGLPLYASKCLEDSVIHMSYQKGLNRPKLFEINDLKSKKIDKFLEYYDVIIARSSVLNNMKRDNVLGKIVDNSKHVVNIKTMSHKPNYGNADHYFEEEEMCPVAGPVFKKSCNSFLKSYPKKNIILIPGTIWYFKNQLKFFEQIDSHLIKDYTVVLAGENKDIPSGYFQKIIDICKNKKINPAFIGNVSEEFLINLYCLSKICAIPMDPRPYGSPKGYPRVLGESIEGKCITLCNKATTVPEFFSDTLLVYDHEVQNSLNKIMKEAKSIVSKENYIKDHNWGKITFEEQCEQILKKCFIK